MNQFPSIATLAWDEGELKATGRGPRLIKRASPNQAFWSDWARNKEEMKAAGIIVRRDGADGPFIVSACFPVPDENETTSSTASTPSGPPMSYSAAQEVRPATSITIIWSEEQEAIFEWGRNGEGCLVVRARAGTGKTTTVKVMFTHCPEKRMIYVVFNKRNQREAELAITDPRVDVRTLHSLGFMFIRQIWSGVKPDNNTEWNRVKSLFEDMPTEVCNQICKLVSWAKNTCVDPTIDDLVSIAEMRDIEAEDYEDEKAGGWTVYRLAEYAHKTLELSKEKPEDGLISFDDMVWLPVVKGWVRGIYDLVCVDECQDMNRLQLEMAVGACRSGGRIVVVGDDRQAIYFFRGAHSNGIDMMKERLAAHELGLTTTYRCPKAVVRLANAIVPDYRAADSAPDGFVETLGYENALAGIQVGDAFLSRINAPLMSACLAVLRRGITARIEGKDIGKTLVAIVKKLKAKSMPHFFERLEGWRVKQTARAKDTQYAKTKLAYIQDQYDTLTAVADGCSAVHEIERRLTDLFQDSDSMARPAVVFSSVHKAKGLEWKKVYMLRSTFGRKRGGKEPSADEKYEEENIRYVAMTRAKEHLVFVDDRAKGQATVEQPGSTATATQAPDPKPKKRKPPQERKAATASEIVGLNSIEQALNEIGHKHETDIPPEEEL
jgi:DNA helicase-2/ATP-dependent DNA helicase PcrA